MKRLSFREGVVALGMSLALLGCGNAVQVPAKKPLAPAVHVTKLPLVGKWEKGTCTFSKNSLTYHNGKSKKSINLDMEAADAEKLVCSADYTVVITPKYAVVALGGEAVLSGIEGFGYLGFVNSYGIEIHPNIPDEGITGGRIMGNSLEVTTRERIWEINFVNPEAWQPKEPDLPRL